MSTADTLRDAGLRATRPRVAVLSYLRDAGGHRTVDDILTGLADGGQALPRATVYDVITDLVAAEVVMAADVGAGTARYEAADEWHHHFVCRLCGRIEDVPCVADERPCLDVAVPGTLDEAQVILRGVCDRCG